MNMNPAHIHIIDDDACTLEILILILDNAGYKVTTNHTASLDFLDWNEKPDLVIMDNNLGITTGTELCRHLKSNPHTAHFPVILISAMQNIEELAKDACADGFLPKPFSINQLQTAIRSNIPSKLSRKHS